ncbi:FecCD family ABC transporter permease [Yinghuangia sp. YIM S09857]|uniref:FecCD family ABC transporter permease n=1 Tax=Yinghuangia sp. YIM S09857 TaxID=3436929 RepID=UPI003F52E432
MAWADPRAGKPAAPPRADPGKILLLLGFAALLAVVCGLSLALGARSIPLGDVWRALVDPAGRDTDLTVREIRVPRTVLGICVGAALGVAGALTQTLTRNPLAEPGLLGITQGAGFAVTVGATTGIAGGQGVQVSLALVGALVAGVVVHAVGRSSPLRLVLAGVALASVLSGVSMSLRILDPDAFDHYRFWSVGSLAGREQAPLLLPVLLILAALVVAFLLTGALNTLALGEDVAHGLGAHVVRTRLAVLSAVTLLAGTATAVVGPIAFLGLMVPHIVRRAAGGSVPWLLAYSALLGPVLLLASDVTGRLLLPTGEVPVAVVTAFFGAPVLIWAVRRYEGSTL